MSTTTIFFIRHATCDGIGSYLRGRLPGIALNERGRLEALRLAARLEAEPLSAVYTSPLERARETAFVIAGTRRLPVHDSDALHEVDYGDWTGRTFDEIRRDPLWERFNARRGTTRIPGGELITEVQDRVLHEVARLRLLHRGQSIALVTHADVIRAAFTRLLGMPVDLLLRLSIEPASVSAAVVGEDGSRVTLLNETSHLRAPR